MTEMLSQLAPMILAERDVSTESSQLAPMILAQKTVYPESSQVSPILLARRHVYPLSSQLGVLILARLYPPGDPNKFVVTYDLCYSMTASSISMTLAWAGALDLKVEYGDDDSTWTELDIGFTTLTHVSYSPRVYEYDVSFVEARYWRVTGIAFIDQTVYPYKAISILDMFMVDLFEGIISVRDPLGVTKVVSEYHEMSSIDDTLLVDCQAPVTVLLPRASSSRRLVTIMKTDSANNNVSILTRGSDTTEVVSLTLDSPFMRLTNNTRSGWTVA